jgi:hypothetical protein
MRKECSLSPLLLNTVLELTPRAVRHRKDIKRTQIEKKEINPSLFADDMILHLKDSETSPKKTPQCHKCLQ